jgi:hypothetical protein
MSRSPRASRIRRRRDCTAPGHMPPARSSVCMGDRTLGRGRTPRRPCGTSSCLSFRSGSRTPPVRLAGRSPALLPPPRLRRLPSPPWDLQPRPQLLRRLHRHSRRAHSPSRPPCRPGRPGSPLGPRTQPTAPACRPVARRRRRCPRHLLRQRRRLPRRPWSHPRCCRLTRTRAPPPPTTPSAAWSYPFPSRCRRLSLRTSGGSSGFTSIPFSSFSLSISSLSPGFQECLVGTKAGRFCVAR